MVIRGTGSEDFFNGGWYDVPGPLGGPRLASLEREPRLQTSPRPHGRLPLPARRRLRLQAKRPLDHRARPRRQQVSFRLHGGHLSLLRKQPAAGNLVFPDRKRKGRRPCERRLHSGLDDADPRLLVVERRPAEDGRQRSAGEDLRHLSLKAEGREVFGPHYISFICEMPAAGTYRVSIRGDRRPRAGRRPNLQERGRPGQARRPLRRPSGGRAARFRWASLS